MKSPKLSIVIPAYNRPEMLDFCLKSMHTISEAIDYEVVVVDDASPLDLSKVVDSHTRRNSRIRYIRNQTSRGIPKNFNYTLAQAHGEYVCMLGDDDAVLPTNFEKKLAVLDRHPSVGLVYSRWYIMNGNDTRPNISFWLGHLACSYIGGRPEFRDLLIANYINLAAAVFRRRLYEEMGGFDENIRTLCDWDMFLRFCQHNETAYLNEYLVSVRMHEGSDTTQVGIRGGQFLKDRLLLWKKWLIDAATPVVIDQNMWARMFDPYRMDLQAMYGQDPAAMAQWNAELETFRLEYLRRMAEHFDKPQANAAAPKVDAGPGRSLPSSSEEERTPIVWEGSFFETDARSIVNRELVLALTRSNRADVTVRLVETGHSTLDPRAAPRLRNLVGLVNRPLGRHPAVHVRSTWPPKFVRPAIGHWVIMQPNGPERLRPDLVRTIRDTVDEVWVHDRASADECIRSGLREEQLFIVPIGVDPACFRPDAEPVELPTQKRFKFLFVGEPAWRNGFPPLLEAYSRLFRKSDDVCLIVQDVGLGSTDTQAAEEAIARLQAATDTPDILYSPRVLPHAAMPSLYAACDCLVQPGGFGLAVLEAMACGLPVIVTGSGEDDGYCPDGTVFWVTAEPGTTNIDQLANADHAASARVPEPDPDSLMTQMRSVYEAGEAARARGRQASDFVRQHFTWDATAEKVAIRLRALTQPQGREASNNKVLAEPLQTAASQSHSDGADAMTLFDEGKRLAGVGNWDLARAALQQAVAINPELWGARYLLGCTELELGRPQEALALLQTAAEALPGVSDFQNGLGSALSRLGRLEEAATAFQRALEVDPGNVHACLNLAELRFNAGETSVAQALLRRAEALDPNNPETDRLLQMLAAPARAKEGTRD